MRRKYDWRWSIGLVAIAIVFVWGAVISNPGQFRSSTMAVAQSPTTQTRSPSVTAPSPAPAPVPQALPSPPLLTTAPLPLAGTYQDPAGRFKVGLLKDYKVSPLAGSVLVEAPDGNLAYAVIAQAQPTGAIGVTPSDTTQLAQIAATVFQRGEGFQPGLPQPEAGGGTLINWTGSLTIAGKSQPVGGVILVRPTARQILLLMVTATEAGADRVDGAFAALASSLQSL